MSCSDSYAEVTNFMLQPRLSLSKVLKCVLFQKKLSFIGMVTAYEYNIYTHSSTMSFASIEANFVSYAMQFRDLYFKKVMFRLRICILKLINLQKNWSLVRTRTRHEKWNEIYFFTDHVTREISSFILQKRSSKGFQALKLSIVCWSRCRKTLSGMPLVCTF